MSMDDGELDPKTFRESVSRFTFKRAPSSTPLRPTGGLIDCPPVKLEFQSSSKPSLLRELVISTQVKPEKIEDELDFKPQVQRASRERSEKPEMKLFTSIFDLESPTKRKRVKSSGSLVPAKKQRGYASPEKYAHLDFLPDHLKDELDGKILTIY